MGQPLSLFTTSLILLPFVSSELAILQPTSSATWNLETPLTIAWSVLGPSDPPLMDIVFYDEFYASNSLTIATDVPVSASVFTISALQLASLPHGYLLDLDSHEDYTWVGALQMFWVTGTAPQATETWSPTLPASLQSSTVAETESTTETGGHGSTTTSEVRGETTVSPSVTLTVSPSSRMSDHSGLSTGAKIAIRIFIPVLVIGILAGVVLVLIQRRRRRQQRIATARPEIPSVRAELESTSYGRRAPRENHDTGREKGAAELEA